MNQITMKIATPVVDHGRLAATSTGYMSTHSSQNRECTAERARADIPEGGGVVLVASGMRYATTADLVGAGRTELPEFPINPRNSTSAEFGATNHENATRNASGSWPPFGCMAGSAETSLLPGKDMQLGSCPTNMNPVLASL
ncbi:hypothetical protein [Bradyrhizobium sp.]|uniref:hypothetical protein n=1 Tax=Bradyrhizobium sp. TaxID=376 RepID=UPI002736218C|nr:hypothetical protein [Bradyrhizobium sp.]MDP3074844.1 hypothetical protein [Bradyrhizobium sp.]